LFWAEVVAQPHAPHGYLGLASYYAVALAMELLRPEDALPSVRMALAQHDALAGETDSSAALRAMLAYVSYGAPHPPLMEAERALQRNPSLAGANFWHGGLRRSARVSQ